MLKKLYYEDINLSEFEANIIKLKKVNDYYHLILDQTAFFPESGGMPADQGTINNEEVINVFKEDDNIIHVVANKIEGKVTGKINLKQRYLNMQEHDAQHLISAILEQDYQLNTISHHLHGKYSDIIVSGDNINNEILKNVETKANELIFKQTPIEKFSITKDQLKDYHIKDNPKYVEPIRIANIKALNDYDPCACLHLDNLAQVQAIKILGYEKNKKNYLIRFSAGQMLLNYVGMLEENMKPIKLELRANDDNVNEKFVNLVKERNNLKTELNDTKDLYYIKLLDELVKENKLIIYHEPSNNFEDIKKLSNIIINYEQPLVAFLQVQNEADNYQFILVKQKDSDYDLKALFDKLKDEYPIKGGGANNSFNGQVNINLANIVKENS